MKYPKISILFLITFLSSACSNPTPELVSNLVELQVPVVQPSSSPSSSDEQDLIATYQENEKILHALTNTLKKRYLTGTKAKDMFDVHSLSHQVYKSLTRLEEAGILNMQYYNERNAAGLNKLNKSLQPYAKQV